MKKLNYFTSGLALIFFGSLGFGADAEIYLEGGVAGANHAYGALDAEGHALGNTALTEDDYRPYKLGFQKNVGMHGCWDFAYVNEGHAPNNHRDGFAMTGCYRMALDNGKKVFVQVNAGPYYSMNTTKDPRRSQFSDQKRLGLMTAAVLEMELSRRLGLNARFEWDYVVNPGGFNSSIVYAGVSKTFDSPSSETRDDDQPLSAANPYSLVVAYGESKTNAPTSAMAKGSLQVEMSKSIRGTPYFYSVSALKEGDTGVTDAEGLAAQLGYNVVRNGPWRAGVKAGPYLSHDARRDSPKANALITMFVDRDLGGNYFVRAQFQRIANKSYPARDRDNFSLGIGKKFD